MNAQLKKGTVELCVLSEINRKDMYGYEVVQSISIFIEVTESTIYPILRRLTNEGCFETYSKKSTEGPNRKYYKITTFGKEKLRCVRKEWELHCINVNNILNGGMLDE